MRTYTLPTQGATERRNSFARDAVFAEFQTKHARAIDYYGFVDRLPHQRPLTIDEIGGRR